MIDQFKKGFDKTVGKSSGSGNSAWEEKKGIKYSTSETRLYDIMEDVCRSGNDCRAALDEAEEIVEEWWKNRDEKLGLKTMYKEICVEQTKLCCAKGKFGKTCKACPGGAKTPCNSHGECKGSGSRAGTGKCKCNSGYSGKKCSKCKKDHYRKGTGADAAFTCEKCDAGCGDGCDGPGLEYCTGECADGYEAAAGVGDAAGAKGCKDVDECAAGTADCAKDTFCKNVPGRADCEKCDESCHPDDGCTAAGPKGCAEGTCADGYEHNADNGCVDIDECAVNASQCAVGKYCFNKPGSVSCLPCATACDEAQGCTDGTPEGCNGCKAGYEPIEGKDQGCQDVDECSKDDACGEGFTCRNSRGSFECNCLSPKIESDGKCHDVAVPEAAVAGEGEGAEEGDEPVKDEL